MWILKEEVQATCFDYTEFMDKLFQMRFSKGEEYEFDQNFKSSGAQTCKF